MKKTLKDAKQNFAVTKKKKPYTDKGKTVFNIRNKSGVYIVYEGLDMVYIGMSTTNLYRTMYRHFQDWKDKKQQRVVFKDLKGITVRVIYCNGTRAQKLEGALILKYKPPLNINKYNQYVLDLEDKELIKEYQDTHEGIYIYKGDLPF